MYLPSFTRVYFPVALMPTIKTSSKGSPFVIHVSGLRQRLREGLFENKRGRSDEEKHSLLRIVEIEFPKATLKEESANETRTFRRSGDSLIGAGVGLAAFRASFSHFCPEFRHTSRKGDKTDPRRAQPTGIQTYLSCICLRRRSPSQEKPAFKPETKANPRCFDPEGRLHRRWYADFDHGPGYDMGLQCSSGRAPCRFRQESPQSVKGCGSHGWTAPFQGPGHELCWRIVWSLGQRNTMVVDTVGCNTHAISP